MIISEESHGWPRVFTTLFVLSFLAGPTSFADEKSPRELAVELVQVMGTDARAALGMHQRADRQFNEGTLKLAQRDCIRLVGREEFTERLASLVDRKLQRGELLDAIAYFRSPIGKRHLAAIENKSNATAEDWPERRAFLDTPAGYLLLTRGLLTNSSELSRAVDMTIRDRFYECENPH